ncbi:hypothetical protein D7B24_009262 [Verticillium nonalfalfae]|uniref:Ribosomal protein S21 n=1 Tax=Verticillium nonalfalfae TaxID=1051616 RepID=A0A3M9YMF1_9PEZI|nr:uncharacterized protein D7B24_009262 [Verticillium nonalfalfae]RNJ60230.1 hypothetical protein D7B24_009262 [Verticillium nonalfalfae]
MSWPGPRHHPFHARSSTNISRASELRLASRRLLQAGALPWKSTMTTRTPPVPWSQPRLFSSSAAVFAPRSDGPAKPTWAARTSPAQNASAVPRPPSSTPRPAGGFAPATAASKSAASDHVYDATSTDTLDLSKIIAAESDDFLRSHYSAPKPELRLKPVLGRTFHCTPRRDMAGALAVLGSAMRANNTKKLARLQKRHERPGLKRKRLRSERWRARFKIGFAATVSRVQELRNQGW